MASASPRYAFPLCCITLAGMVTGLLTTALPHTPTSTPDPVSAASADPRSTARTTVDRLPPQQAAALGAVRFEPNVGQFAPSVNLLARGGHGTAVISGASIAIAPDSGARTPVRMTFEGARPDAAVEPLEQLPGRTTT